MRCFPDAIYTMCLIRSLSCFAYVNEEEVEREREREEDLRSKQQRQNIFRPHLFIFLSIFTPFLLFLSSSSSPSPGVFLRRDASVPQFEEAVPGSCADAHTVIGDAGAAHPVVMTGQHTWGRRAGEGIEKKWFVMFFYIYLS